MQKRLVDEPIGYGLDVESISITDLRKDLDKLEDLGATKLIVDVVTCTLDAVKERLETDEEFEARKTMADKIATRRRDNELALYKELKEKYESE